MNRRYAETVIGMRAALDRRNNLLCLWSMWTGDIYGRVDCIMLWLQSCHYVYGLE